MSAIHFDASELAPLIRTIAAEVALALQADQAALPGNRLAWSEAEAAAMLGLAVHQLRDERLRGRVQASIGPGKKLLYSRQDLVDYLASRRWTPEGQANNSQAAPRSKNKRGAGA